MTASGATRTLPSPEAGPRRASVAAERARPAFLLAGCAALGWALLDPRFRDAEGSWRGTVCLPISLAAAAAILGFTPRAWGASRYWLALAMIGEAATLQLTLAGPRVAYQHLAFDAADPWAWGCLSAVLVQGVAVAYGGWARTRARRETPRPFGDARGLHFGLLRRWQLALLALAFVLSSAAVSRDPKVFAAELVAASAMQALALANLWLAVLALPPETARRWGQRWHDWFGPETRGATGRDPVAWLAAVGVTVACSVLSWFVYERHPHVPDEVVYLIHARYLAEGRLTLPAQPAPEAFNLDLLSYEADRWYCPVPPGWPAVLALGAWVNAAWLVNPLLAGVNTLLAYRLTVDLYDRGTARLVALLMAVSPWFVFMGMNFMTHQWTLSCALAAAVLLARVAHGSSPAWAVASGGFLGLLSMIRPLEALCVAAVLGLGSLRMRRGFPGLTSLLLVIGAVLVGAVQLPYNARLTGDPLKFPIMAYTDRYYGPGRNDLGFGANRGLGWTGLDPRPGHDLLDAALNADLNFFAINVELFGWAIGSLAPVLLVLLLPGRRRADVGLAAAAAVVVCAHAAYWFSGGPDFGARYWFLVVYPCVALAARGAIELARAGRGSDEQGRVAWSLAMLSLLALINFFPWRSLDKYRHYRGMRPDLGRLSRELDWRDALVLVRGERHPDYASAAIFNPLELSADQPIYAWDRSWSARRAAVEAFADRPVWIVDGPSLTRRGYRVVAGPLPGSAVASERFAVTPYVPQSPLPPRAVGEAGPP